MTDRSQLIKDAYTWVARNYPVLQDEDLDAEHYRRGDNAAVDARADLRQAFADFITEVLEGQEADVPTYSFEAETWHLLTGRGWLAVIKDAPAKLATYGIWEPTDLTNRLVTIDGVVHRVIGVETFQIGRTPARPYRLPFSLLVKSA